MSVSPLYWVQVISKYVGPSNLGTRREREYRLIRRLRVCGSRPRYPRMPASSAGGAESDDSSRGRSGDSAVEERCPPDTFRSDRMHRILVLVASLRARTEAIAGTPGPITNARHRLSDRVSANTAYPVVPGSSIWASAWRNGASCRQG